jgi:Rod binding domain-containing protein
MPEPIPSNPAGPPAPRNSPADRLRRANGPHRADPDAADARLNAACKDMEALFIHHMLSEMRKTVAKSGLIDGGRSEEIYTSLMDAELAKEMARSGGLGLSAILQEQLGGLGAPPRSKTPKR